MLQPPFSLRRCWTIATHIKLVLDVNHAHLWAENRGRWAEVVQHITALLRDLSKFHADMVEVVAALSNNIRTYYLETNMSHVRFQIIRSGYSSNISVPACPPMETARPSENLWLQKKKALQQSSNWRNDSPDGRTSRITRSNVHVVHAHVLAP